MFLETDPVPVVLEKKIIFRNVYDNDNAKNNSNTKFQAEMIS